MAIKAVPGRCLSLADRNSTADNHEGLCSSVLGKLIFQSFPICSRKKESSEGLIRFHRHDVGLIAAGVEEDQLRKSIGTIPLCIKMMRSSFDRIFGSRPLDVTSECLMCLRRDVSLWGRLAGFYIPAFKSNWNLNEWISSFEGLLVWFSSSPPPRRTIWA